MVPHHVVPSGLIGSETSLAPGSVSLHLGLMHLPSVGDVAPLGLKGERDVLFLGGMCIYADIHFCFAGRGGIFAFRAYIFIYFLAFSKKVVLLYV